MRRFTSIFVTKRDKKSDLSSSSSSTNSDHNSTTWKAWIGVKRSSQPPPPTPTPLVESEEDDDDEEDEEDEEEEEDHHNIRIHIQNSLVVDRQLPNSPFLHQPNQPLFPRSSNSILLSQKSSTLKSMFNSHLLARLDSSALSPSESSSILPFASKFTPSSITHPILPSSDIPLPKNPSYISSASLGIQRWINRPCFEDRFIVYLQTDSGIQCRPVTSSIPIAALEYPEHLDVMVNPDFDQSFPTPERNVLNDPPPPEPYSAPSIQSHDSATESNPTLVTPVHWHNSSTVVPSPLRIQHSPPKQEMPVPVVITPTPKTTVKRVVRFAEDDEEDGIPLHMVRMKKKREEKAKFLRLEQLKRAKEEEEERKVQEQEVLEKERRRLSKEKEKKEMDKLFYAEAIVAARLRREGHRAGYTTNTERNKPPLFDSTPRRDNSDSASSPGSSRPSSIGHSPVHHSRPPSTYSAHTSSSEDVRPQRGTKRNSVTPAVASSVSGGPSSYHPPPMLSSYPSWSANNQSTPHVPSLPEFVLDMPLLPPAAPFMKGSSYIRTSGPSSTSSSRRGSFNSSNERLTQPHPLQMTRTSSSSSTSRHHTTTTGPPPHSKPEKRPTHERKSSDDSRTLSLHSTQHQQRPIPTSSSSLPTLTRGRPPLPSSSRYLQSSSPWPALSSQNGLMPMPMSMAYGPMNGYPVLLYPTGPMPTMQATQSGGGRGGGGGMGGNNSGWRESLIS